MRIVNEFAPGALGGATSLPSTSSDSASSRPGVSIFRRIGAIVRLIARRRRFRQALFRQALAGLQPLDRAALRDLGLGVDEVRAVASEVHGRIAAQRHQAELNYLLSASSRFAVRNVDVGL